MAEESVVTAKKRLRTPPNEKLINRWSRGKVLKSQEVNIFTSMAAGLVNVCCPKFCQSGPCCLGFIFPLWAWF